MKDVYDDSVSDVFRVQVIMGFLKISSKIPDGTGLCTIEEENRIVKAEGKIQGTGAKIIVIPH